MSKKMQDHTGKRYGKLTVLAHAPKVPGSSNKNRWWRCRCDCGREVMRTICSFSSATEYASCGCTRKPYEWKTHIDPTEDFMGKISKKDDGCWEWTAKSLKVKGWPYKTYGTMSVSRIVYQITTGAPVPRDVRLVRACKNKKCVNPAHKNLLTDKRYRSN